MKFNVEKLLRLAVVIAAIAIENARLQSLAAPDTVVYVMDKPKMEAVTATSAFVMRERILEGWHTVIRFINGREA